MLADKDRIFTNLYGFQDAGLAGARARGQWNGTKAFIDKGHDAIINEVKASGLRGRGYHAQRSCAHEWMKNVEPVVVHRMPRSAPPCAPCGEGPGVGALQARPEQVPPTPPRKGEGRRKCGQQLMVDIATRRFVRAAGAHMDG